MACPLCGEPAPPPLFHKSGYPIARCRCGMIFVSQPITAAELERLYAEAYYTGNGPSDVPGYLGYAEEEPVMRRNFYRRLRLLERFSPPGPLLDVGCALGFFLGAARERGWDARGIELSGYAVNEAKARGFSVELGDFLTREFDLSAFSAITMFDVLEHLAAPRAHVRRARKLLRGGGVLAIETADLTSPMAWLFGERYHVYSPPNHLSYFTRATLERLLREEGFSDVTFFRVGKWVTFRRALYRLYVGGPYRGLKPLLDLAEWTRVARLPLPINFGDSVLAIARA